MNRSLFTLILGVLLMGAHGLYSIERIGLADALNTFAQYIGAHKLELYNLTRVQAQECIEPYIAACKTDIEQVFTCAAEADRSQELTNFDFGATLSYFKETFTTQQFTSRLLDYFTCRLITHDRVVGWTLDYLFTNPAFMLFFKICLPALAHQEYSTLKQTYMHYCTYYPCASGEIFKSKGQPLDTRSFIEAVATLSPDECAVIKSIVAANPKGSLSVLLSNFIRDELVKLTPTARALLFYRLEQQVPEALPATEPLWQATQVSYELFRGTKHIVELSADELNTKAECIQLYTYLLLTLSARDLALLESYISGHALTGSLEQRPFLTQILFALDAQDHEAGRPLFFKALGVKSKELINDAIAALTCYHKQTT